MTVICVGSVNIDHVYRVPHLVRPGETLAADAYAKGLGGKGANQSIAAAKAGATTRHLGRVGPEARFALDQLAAAGVDVSGIETGEDPSGHAIITVDPSGENAIVLFSGANHLLSDTRVEAGLAGFGLGDTLILQNEVNLSGHAARVARQNGLRVVYSAAPFDVDAVEEMLPLIDLLLLNEGEAAALETALNREISDLSDIETVVTRGADGAVWTFAHGRIVQPAFRVSEIVDTTGAGDCFAGYLVAGLDAGASREEAIERASAAAALQVTRPGAADAMPSIGEVLRFLKARKL
ncbi:ribokinase [Rhodophyticola porphyridii]|uniref:Ribokinase n=1 Tax=Rhodophyticola porphyridii TaxID=1852017 RepID=A0A3L9YJ50_9RHOB|nr:ribokinase [Rhodophyticola porphyridii]RMA42820.1 ribokinase [Rhodophyticola porphyridii]